MKLTLDINVPRIIEEVEDQVPNPTGSRETEESAEAYIEDYIDEVRDCVEAFIVEKLVHYHTH